MLAGLNQFGQIAGLLRFVAGDRTKGTDGNIVDNPAPIGPTGLWIGSPEIDGLVTEFVISQGGLAEIVESAPIADGVWLIPIPIGYGLIIYWQKRDNFSLLSADKASHPTGDGSPVDEAAS